MIPVRFSVRSLSDRDRVLTFLASQSPAAAEKVVILLAEGVDQIARFPNIGMAGPAGYRKLIVRFGKAGYELRYRVYPDVVIVTRIFHTRENR